MIEIDEIIRKMEERNASSVHLSAGVPPLLNINDRLLPASSTAVENKDIEQLARNLLGDIGAKNFIKNNCIDFTFYSASGQRVRITFFKQKSLISAVFKPFSAHVPTLEELHLPSFISRVTKLKSGLVIIGGSAGSGKSSTLAALLDEINKTRSCHIITIEDPIEYFHTSCKSLFSQREIGVDTATFSNALHRAIRQDADVIMIAEIRDAETISTALSAAETGMLVLGTMHTTDCVQTITRLIGAFPTDNQQQIRVQVAITLKAIICQQLVMGTDGINRSPAVEMLFESPAIKSLIRENKLHQIYSAIENGSEFGMQTLDQSLQKLYKTNIISDLEVVSKAVKPEQLRKKVFDSAIPLPDAQTKRFVDMGEEMIPIERKMIHYKANFSPGQEGSWTSSVAVIFQDSSLVLMPSADMSLSRLHVSDFNIVGKKIPAFELPHRLLLRFKLEKGPNVPAQNDAQLLIKFFTQPEKEKITSYNKINLSFPLEIDTRWHTWVITIPREEAGKLLKITMFEFPVFLTKVTISDMIMF